MGEISTNCYIDIADTARNIIKEVGYDNPSSSFDGNTCSIVTSINFQSPDIAMGVDESLEVKSGKNNIENQI